LHLQLQLSWYIICYAVLVKVPGHYSGFLAVDAAAAARNANVCLVPEFNIDLYG
jgi:6-phosphofructokinase